jgi:hypothetical protein
MIIETLNRIESRAKALSNTTNDIDNECRVRIDQALSLLDECVSIVLTTQKARGKVFISNEEIDEIFKNLNI